MDERASRPHPGTHPTPDSLPWPSGTGAVPVLEELFEGAAIFDPGGRCLWANRAFARMVRSPRRELRGVHWSAFADPDAVEALRRLARDGRSGAACDAAGTEVRCGRTDGSAFEGRLRLLPAEGRGVVVLLENLSGSRAREARLSSRADEAERMRSELAQRNQDLEEFAYVAAHDLREPARKLLAFSDVLRDDLGDALGELVSRDLGRIRTAAERMQALIESLLTLARMSRADLRPEPLVLADCAEAARSDLALAIEQGDARIDSDPLPTVVGDRTLVEQIYRNLLGNALAHAGPAARIRLTAERVGGWILGVEDDGPGVDPSMADAIFRPFESGGNARSRRGCGMGLAICRRAVECHRGRIWVEPGREGGAHFRFTLGEAGDGPRREGS